MVLGLFMVAMVTCTLCMHRNFYRKVSKYDLDRLTVDWKELMRERQRQMKANQVIQKEEMGAAEN